MRILIFWTSQSRSRVQVEHIQLENFRGLRQQRRRLLRCNPVINYRILGDLMTELQFSCFEIMFIKIGTRQNGNNSDPNPEVQYTKFCKFCAQKNSSLICKHSHHTLGLWETELVACHSTGPTPSCPHPAPYGVYLCILHDNVLLTLSGLNTWHSFKQHHMGFSH